MIACHGLDANHSHHTLLQARGTHPPNTLHYQDRGYARSCNPYTSENATSSTRFGESKGIEDRLVFAIPYVSRDSVCYKRVASGYPNRCRPCKLTQGRSELCPMSFALLTVVLAMAMVALVLLLYYLLRRWI